jgi:hypothetical protein
MTLNCRFSSALYILLFLCTVNFAAFADSTPAGDVITVTKGFYSSLRSSSSNLYWRRDGDVYKATLSKTGPISDHPLLQKTIPVSAVEHFKALLQSSKNCAIPSTNQPASYSCFSGDDRRKLIDVMRQSKPELYAFFQNRDWHITDSDLRGAVTLAIPFSYGGLAGTYTSLTISGDSEMGVSLNWFPWAINYNGVRWHTYSTAVPSEAFKLFVSPFDHSDPATDWTLVETVAAELINKHAQVLWGEATEGLASAKSLRAAKAQIDLFRVSRKLNEISLTLTPTDTAAIVTRFSWNTTYADGKIKGDVEQVLASATNVERLARSIPWLRNWINLDADCGLSSWLPLGKDVTLGLVDGERMIGLVRFEEGGSTVQTAVFNQASLPTLSERPSIPTLPTGPRAGDLVNAEITSLADEPKSISRYIAARKHFFVARWSMPTKLLWKMPDALAGIWIWPCFNPGNLNVWDDCWNQYQQSENSFKVSEGAKGLRKNSNNLKVFAWCIHKDQQRLITDAQIKSFWSEIGFKDIPYAYYVEQPSGAPYFIFLSKSNKQAVIYLQGANSKESIWDPTASLQFDARTKTRGSYRDPIFIVDPQRLPATVNLTTLTNCPSAKRLFYD